MDNSEPDSEWGEGNPIWVPLPEAMADCPVWWQNFANSLDYTNISDEDRRTLMARKMKQSNVMWYYADNYITPSFHYKQEELGGVVFKSEEDFIIFKLKY